MTDQAGARRRQHCGLCGHAQLDEVLDLPYTPIANEYLKVKERQAHHRLNLVMCSRCRHVQIGTIIDPEILFPADYPYATGTSAITREHFAFQVAQDVSRFRLDGGSKVVEIGSNDGTVLRRFHAEGVPHTIGIDPAVAVAGDDDGQGITYAKFFSAKLADQLVIDHGQADLVIANNVFAHAPDLVDMFHGVRAILAPEGAFVFEVSYLLDVVEHLLFDTIYHEHFSYHALAPLEYALPRLGLRIFDMEHTAPHGGSLRVFVCHEKAHWPTERRVGATMTDERLAMLHQPRTYATFGERIIRHAFLVQRRLDAHLALGKRLIGYGAPAKLTTFMYGLGLGPQHAEFIVEDSPWKQGRYTPGMQIPIIGRDRFDAARPQIDVCTIFAWNYAESILRGCGQAARTYVIPMPDYWEVNS